MIGQAGSLLLEVLRDVEEPPVLVDIGSSGDAPPIWDEIASSSFYIGFDPDLREVRDLSNGRFRRSVMFNEAVTAEANTDSVQFFLTRSPYCSSTLLPDKESLEQYIFSDLFSVQEEASVRATTLEEVSKRLALSNMDWIKIDSQGTDLRLFTSLPEHLRSGVLALDVEPGLIDAYVGEDLFVDTHQALTRAGFWLSFANVQGAVRVKKATLERLSRLDNIDQVTIEEGVRRSPGWCECRYLKTIESLVAHKSSERQHILLWLFAMVDGQFAFASDVALDFEIRFPGSRSAELMMKLPADRIRESRLSTSQKSQPAFQPKLPWWTGWLRPRR